MLRLLTTIKVLDPSEFNTIIANLDEYSLVVCSLKKDKLVVGIFSEDEDDDYGFSDEIEEAISYFKIKKVENMNLKEYDLEVNWCC